MTYAFFPGCKIPHHLPAYGRAVKSLCSALDIKLLSLEFNCCGYPVRHQSFEAWILSSARNLAIAERAGLTIMTPCKCCFGNLKHAAYWLEQTPDLKRDTARRLQQEGLVLPDNPQAFHLLTILDRDIGNAHISNIATHALAGIKVAAHYGCHALRPGNITGFDDPMNPTLFERLLTAFGADPVPWSLRVECCGNPLRDRHDALSKSLAHKKIADARAAGANIIATACTYCQLQFEGLDSNIFPRPVLAAQLFGLGIGLSPQSVGLTETPGYLSSKKSSGMKV